MHFRPFCKVDFYPANAGTFPIYRGTSFVLLVLGCGPLVSCRGFRLLHWTLEIGYWIFQSNNPGSLTSELKRLLTAHNPQCRCLRPSRFFIFDMYFCILHFNFLFEVAVLGTQDVFYEQRTMNNEL